MSVDPGDLLPAVLPRATGARATVALDPQSGSSPWDVLLFEAMPSNTYAQILPMASVPMVVHVGARGEGQVISDHRAPEAPPLLVLPRRNWLPFVFYMLAAVMAVCAVWFSSMAFSALIAIPAMVGIYMQQRDYQRRMRAIGEAVVAEAKFIRARYSFAEYSPYLARARQSLIKHGVDDLVVQLPQS
jgi:hypothetical protein